LLGYKTLENFNLNNSFRTYELNIKVPCEEKNIHEVVCNMKSASRIAEQKGRSAYLFLKGYHQSHSFCVSLNKEEKRLKNGIITKTNNQQ